MQIQADVVSKMLEGEEVILHLKSGTYFGLNATGTLLFNILKSGKGRSAMIQSLIEEYELDKSSASADVDEFLETLRKHQLICGEA